MTVLAAAAATSSHSLLITAALLGIATVVVLITWLKVHPFLALILGSAVLGAVARYGASNTIDSFTKGVGATVGSVGLLIALGAMIGGLLADSGGADTVVRTTVDRVSARALPWALALVAALIGIPLFFEVGVVLLVPIVLLVARRTDVPLMRIGIPALAGLSVLHGFIPPHPGPLVAISALKADLGLTLAFGLLLAIPCVIIAGPVFATFISRYVTASPDRGLLLGHERGDIGAGGALAGSDLGDPNTVGKPRGGVDTDIDPYGGGGTPARQRERVVETTGGSRSAAAHGRVAEPATASAGGTPATAGGLADTRASASELLRHPGVVPTVVTVLLPVVLMLARAVGELWVADGSTTRNVLDVIGSPIIALLAGTIVAMFTLGVASGMNRGRISDSLGGSLGPIAGILLIVAAGGGFKQTLVDAGVGKVIASWANGAHISALLLGWLVAVGIRLATGSATVATITAAGIVAPLAAGLDRPHDALLVLAVGAGSLFFSHVNDAGFWLVKEYFGLTVGETIRSWSVMETIISVVGLGGVLVLNVVV